MVKSDTHIFTGMQKDNDIHLHKPEYLLDALNIRLVARDKKTLLAVTNEVGNKKIDNINLEGTYLGHCVINKLLTVFTKSTEDIIYRIDTTDYTVDILYHGDLNFSLDNKIKTLGIYESELIQKVYWIDGRNQPRLINIVKDKLLKETPEYTSDSFNFVNELALKENVSIKKVSNANGQFPAGVVQYAFSYYNKYGQETNIAYVSPLLYTSYLERAGSPESVLNNAFELTITNYDTNFEYLRLYSIVRTSIDGTPDTRIVNDYKIDREAKKMVITDNHTYGTTISPSDLLYIGGESIIPKTLTQKDNTLFFGNYEISRPSVKEFNTQLKSSCKFNTYSRNIGSTSVNNNLYTYINTLNGTNGITGFKIGEVYRLGVQFQYKTGKWSEPVYLKDYTVDTSLSTLEYNKAIAIRAVLNTKGLKDKGYKKARGVVVFPSTSERKIITQGLLNPTVFNNHYRRLNMPYAQSSWFLRPFPANGTFDNRTNILSGAHVQFHHKRTLFGLESRGAEIWGTPPELSNKLIDNINNYITQGTDLTLQYSGVGDTETTTISSTALKSVDIYGVDQSILNLYSADIEFDDSIHHLDFTGTNLNVVGRALFTNNSGDIDINTSSTMINPSASGFIHNVIRGTSGKSLCAGLFYEDYFVDDDNSKDKYSTYYYEYEKSAVLWMVYPWHKAGSLNNDYVKNNNTAVRSSVLKRKVISNIKVSNKVTWFKPQRLSSTTPMLFSSDQMELLRLKTNNDTINYYGNVDTVVSPIAARGHIFSVGITDSGSIPTSLKNLNSNVSFEDTNTLFITNRKSKEAIHLRSSSENYNNTGYDSKIKFSTTEIGNHLENSLQCSKETERIKYKTVPHLAVTLTDTNLEDLTSKVVGYCDYDFLYLGEIVRDEDPTFGGNTESALMNNQWLPAGKPFDISDSTVIEYTYGDTYYQRYDFLKTYPFTNEDENSIVEVGSILCESRVNCDARYDKNRGQLSNLYMTPQNFNLMNPVYNQLDNFFNYRILDSDFYELNKFENSLTWTLEKKNMSDIDTWTSLTLASTMDLDGDKGEITSLNTFNSKIYCFQNTGVSVISFNNRVQIPASDGIPIEITNNYKVDGKIYLSETSGTYSNDTVAISSVGIYFIDTSNKDLFLIGGEGLANISKKCNFSTWFEKQDSENLKLYYNTAENELYINTPNISLNYSEYLQQFTSFFNYEKACNMFNISFDFFAFETGSNTTLWKMFGGENNSYFGEQKPYYITFASNLESSVDKIFATLEYRGDFFNGEELSSSTFDTIRAFNEYQDTMDVDLTLSNCKPSNTKEKYRIWRIDIPRDKKDTIHKFNRIRNLWTGITLTKNTNLDESMILHNLNVLYYE